MKKIIFTFLAFLLVTACSQSIPGEDNEVIKSSHNDSYPEITTQGLVHYQEDDVGIKFNLNEVKITPAFDLLIGEVSHMEMSPNNQFLYIATAQGGGTASFIYSLEKNEVYFLGNEIRDIGSWQTEGKLKVINEAHFGEDIGKVLSVYESLDNTEPWNLTKVE